MTRETLRLEPTEDHEALISREGDDYLGGEYEHIEKTTSYYDTEKRYTDYLVVIRRISDGKYFRFTYANWGHGDVEVNYEGKEVFPETVTITKYK